MRAHTHTHTDRPLVVNLNSSLQKDGVFVPFAPVAAFVGVVHEKNTPVQCPHTHAHTDAQI